MSRGLTPAEVRALTVPKPINPNVILAIYSVVMIVLGLGIGKMIWG